MAHSTTVKIFLTAYSAHAFKTCQRQSKILAEGHTSLYMEVNVRITTLRHTNECEVHVQAMVIP